MRLSTKARYATRALIELAGYYGDKPVPLKEIARSQDISVKYLEQILFPLNLMGIVGTRKGIGGGHYLKKPPEEVNIKMIVQAVEGSLAPVDCVEDPSSCSRVSYCEAYQAWKRLGRVIEEELEAIHLKDFVQ